MALSRQEKAVKIDEVSAMVAQAKAIVVAEYRGLNVESVTRLRRQARSQGVQLRVLKNTLARRALAGTPFAVLADRLAGPLVYGMGPDPVAVAKVLSSFAKDNDKLVVKAGDTVTFRNGDETDIHTVTFGPAPLRLHIEKDFVAPHGKQLLLSPLGAFPSEPPGSGTVQYDGANHGHGYINSGVLNPRGAPASAGPQTYRVTFTKPGTYHYECVVHQNMDGTIVVH